MAEVVSRSAVHKYMRETAGLTDEYTSTRLALLKPIPEVYQPCSYLPNLRAGQSKQRSSLGRLMYELLGGQNQEELIPVLAFIELSTDATYVLDDLIDDQPMRNGADATHEKFGINDAIIAGNLQTFVSLQMLRQIELTDTRDQFMGWALDMWETLWRGEGRNEHMGSVTTLDDYLERSYEICGTMYETATKMCALMALRDIDHELVDWAGNFGKVFGTAVMVRNDLTSFLPERIMSQRSSALSRKSFEDIRRGIWTHPVLMVMCEGKEAHKQHVQDVFATAADASDDDLEIFSRWLYSQGYIEKTLTLVTELKKRCITSLTVTLGMVHDSSYNSERPMSYLQVMCELLENTRNYWKEFAEDV